MTVISSSWTYYNDFWKYDPSNDSWTQIPNLSSQPRIGAIGFSINNTGYVGLGFLPPSYSVLNDLWSFTDTSLHEGVNEITQKNSIHIYPNPFSTQTTLKTDNLLHNATLTLYNLYGQTAKQFVIRNSASFVISRDGLPSGLYFIRLVQDGKTVATDKLIITDN